MKINSVTIKGNQTLNLGKLTVLVGPNNSGKSRTLRDIASWVTTGGTDNCVLVQDIGLSWPSQFLDTDQDIVARLSSLMLPEMALEPIPNSPNNYTVAGRRFDGAPSSSFHTAYPSGHYDTPAGRQQIFQSLGPYWVTLLDGESRLTVTKTGPTPHMHTQPPRPANLMQALLFDELGQERRLRDAFYDAFGEDIVQDASDLQEVMFRVARDFSGISPLDRKDYRIMGGFPVLDNQGDGYKSLGGLC